MTFFFRKRPHSLEMFSFILVKPAKPAPKEVRQAFIPVTAERTTTEAQATTETQTATEAQRSTATEAQRSTATEAQSITTESPSNAMSNTLSTYPTGMNAHLYKDIILDRLIL